ncbi:GNAT family N-acetyltransferase [Candidatus Frankia nodulisporulans]|uniref:GNAT family N-acetyltransferase n=1 Tax=Candidatus Frankia nodulisporulans TaxID=2060052 RepID=UPI0013D65DB5|nr:GNAT family N-acetyltransferase [Candidatus Frankia nodulisporulans]
MTITVAAASIADADALTDLMQDLDTFYGAPPTDPRPQRLAHIRRLLLSGQTSPAVLLAREDHEVLGMAAYAFLWPAAGVTQSLFLKELYVREHARRRGIGGLLMDHLRRIATETGCSRIEWTTDLDNQSAQSFYRAQGFTVNTGKVFYRTEI